MNMSDMAMDYRYARVDIIKAFGKIINLMDLEKRYTMMEILMKDTGKMIKFKGK